MIIEINKQYCTISWKIYYNNIGYVHRENDYAVKYGSGGKYWYINGIIHRDNGPAIDCIDKKIWYKNGIWHRLDGPAVQTTIDKNNTWHINSIGLNKNEFNSWILRIRKCI